MEHWNRLLLPQPGIASPQQVHQLSHLFLDRTDPIQELFTN